MCLIDFNNTMHLKKEIRKSMKSCIRRNITLLNLPSTKLLSKLLWPLGLTNNWSGANIVFLAIKWNEIPVGLISPKVKNTLQVEAKMIIKTPFDHFIDLFWFYKYYRSFIMFRTSCLGCHTYFEEGEKVPLESISVEFKNYFLPLKDSKPKWILLKTMVGFLNSKGGTIYIGI